MLQAAILAITRVAGQRTQRELNPGSRGPSGSLRSLDTGPSRHLQEDTRKRRPTGCPGVQGPPALQGSAGWVLTQARLAQASHVRAPCAHLCCLMVTDVQGMGALARAGQARQCLRTDGLAGVLVVLFMLLLPFNLCCLRKLDQPERKKSLKCTCGEGQKTEYLQPA